MLNDDLKTQEEACCVAADYAARHNANEQKAKDFAVTWFVQGEGADRSSSALESLLKRILDV